MYFVMRIKYKPQDAFLEFLYYGMLKILWNMLSYPQMKTIFISRSV